MGPRRSYGSYNDGCATAHALDIVGDRWAMIVVRELILGPKRFTDLQNDVVGISPAILTQRLHGLENHGVVQRRQLPGPGRVDVYDLTPWGTQLEAVNTALALWAVGSPELPRDADMSPDTIVLAMRAHARPVLTGVDERRIGLTLTDTRRADSAATRYVAQLSASQTSIERSDRTNTTDATDAEVIATTRSWKACVIGGAPLDGAPDIHVTGALDAVRALVAATSISLP